MEVVLSWIRFGLTAVGLLGGLIVVGIAVCGVYRFGYALNRMHAAAMLDTLGILFVLAALLFFWGISFASLKVLLIILFLWMASPVSSHLISRLEVTTNEKLEEECEVEKDGTC
ncbi:MAG: monovalent cation/H(+) antiporter subunit G [Lachnospiraceae bacterium]|nr:monovalent cation/H(+) antiporter subunit G [Lachnospiraceae bacterium]